MMNLYLISRDDYAGYDEYTSAVVAAPTKAEAKEMHPEGTWEDGVCIDKEYLRDDAWVSPDHIKVTLLGTAKRGVKKGVIHSSFRAG